MGPFASRFQDYFQRPIAQEAASSLSDGIQVEIRVDTEIFVLTRKNGSNTVETGASMSPDLVFSLTPAAAEKVLTGPSENIGEIGVHIARLVFSQDPAERIAFHIRAGFLTLFSRGYFGVIPKGGTAFAGFLASKGLSGMSAIKAAIKNAKK